MGTSKFIYHDEILEYFLVHIANAWFNGISYLEFHSIPKIIFNKLIADYFNYVLQFLPGLLVTKLLGFSKSKLTNFL